MTTEEAIDHYGGVRALAYSLGLTTAAVYAWGRYPPLGRQYQLEIKTGGALRATMPREMARAANG